VTPKLEWIGLSKANQKLNTYISTGSPPTLYEGDPSVSRFYKHLEDITDLADSLNVPKGVGFRGEVNGKTTVVPHHIQPNAKWYRADVYEKAGVKAPKTWSEQLDVAKTLQSSLPKKQYPEEVQAGPNTTIWNHMATSFDMLDVNYIQRTGSGLKDVKVTLGESSHRANAIKVLEHFHQMYQYSPDTTNYGWPDQILPYVNGTVMTMPYEGRILNNVNAQAPKLLEKTKLAPFPMPDGAKKYETFAINNTLAIPQNKHADLARNFLKWLFKSDYYTKLMLAVPGSNVPFDISLLDKPAYQNNEVWASTPGQEYKKYIQQYWPDQMYSSDVGRTNPPSPYWRALTQNTKIIPNMCAYAVTGRKQPAKAVDDATKQLKAQLPKVLKQA